MKVIRVFNNNIVATITNENKEAIAQGSGIGFQKKPGDLLDESKIEKMYYILDEHQSKFNELFDQTPIEYFQIAELIMEKAQRELNVVLSNQIVIALTDHIYFAVERAKQGIYMPNLMNDEILHLYREEYRIAEWSLKKIEEITGVLLSQDEAGFIALHIVNAVLQVGTEGVSNTLMLVKGVMDIVRNIYHIPLDPEQLDTSRFMAHLKFLAQRVLYREQPKLTAVEELYDLLILKEARLETCVNQIAQFIQETFDHTISAQEKVYLMIHLLRVIK